MRRTPMLVSLPIHRAATTPGHARQTWQGTETEADNARVTEEIPGRGAHGLVEPAPLDEARSPSREQGTGGLPPVPLVPYSGGAGS